MTTKEILEKYKKIAVIGFSDNPARDSNKIAFYMLRNGYTVYGVNPKLEGKKFVENGVTYTSEVAIADGTGYKVELLSRENNRQYSISNPIGYYKHYTDSKPLKDFNRILEILSAVYDYGFE